MYNFKNIKVLIFAGGFGTRMNNGTSGDLKPLIEVGGKEILAHIISIYREFGVKNYILLGGYKVEDLLIFAKNNSTENYIISVLDTGLGTPTGGRLLKSKNLITEDIFFLTYGDSLTNFNLTKATNLMFQSKANMLISTFKKKLEYGVLDFDETSILKIIHEKTFSVPINAGFYILNNKVFEYIYSLDDSFEIDVLPRVLLDKSNKIVVNELSFWHPMDTPADRDRLNKILLDNPRILFE
jgi:glucose-1-phosphate cytidylyltransferase